MEKTYLGNPATGRRAGEGHQFAKLTDQQVDDIRRDYRYGMGKIMAKDYNVAPYTITGIARGTFRTIKPVEIPAPTLEVLRVRKSRQYQADPAAAAAKRKAHRIANHEHTNALRRAKYQTKDLETINAARREHLSANKDRINARRRELARLKREAKRAKL